KYKGNDDQAGNLEHAQKTATAYYLDRQHGQGKTPSKAADLLNHAQLPSQLIFDFLLIGLGHVPYLLDKIRRGGQDLRHLLDGPESSPEAESDHDRGHNGGSLQSRRKQLGKVRPLQGSSTFLILPRRRFGKKRPDEDERNGWDQP